MILNNTPQNEAILSNVGAVGEFRIRNSAKAFSILSSGLYANKIRAIIRELSCNAVDSHIAAGKASTPFDIHLPNSLEPWFSIRDYGTGLSHDQVTNIYTTYFESTKTDSNEFIGALGLGSKSPFSYTDNFTVTAVKDGSKRIYAAFINDQGVPSIALMSDNDTDEPNGVEVKFSVNDRYDFRKFIDEAREVYTHFKLRPVVSGASGFTFTNTEYTDKDIIPGAHVVKTIYSSGPSVAIMGNIAYPISIPESDKTLKAELRSMLKCNLELNFDIGELDFQASREGLSYIPTTVDAIKRKLEAISAQLSVRLADEASKLDNLWERAVYIVKRKGESLWQAAAYKYIADFKPALVNPVSHWSGTHTFQLRDCDLASKYNIVIRGFHHSTHYRVARNVKPATVSETTGPTTSITRLQWSIGVDLTTTLVFNDTKVGALQRAKYHWKKTKNVDGTVLVIEPADRKKPISKDAFLKDLMNPPTKQIVMASTLQQPDRAASIGKNVSILQLVSRSVGRGWRSEVKMVWEPAGKAEDFDKKKTFYYLPVKGFQSTGKILDVKMMRKYLNDSGVFVDTVYGVRKADIDYIKGRKNWIDLDKHVVDVLSKLGSENVMSLVKQSIDFNSFAKYNITTLIDTKSPYAKFVNEFKDVQAPKGAEYQRAVQFLCNAYNIKTITNEEPIALIKKWEGVVKDLNKRYPMLKHLESYRSVSSNITGDVAEYVKLIDATKGF